MAAREAQAEADPGQGRVVLACLSSIILRVLPAVAKAFKDRWPSATLVIRETDPDLCIQQVKLEKADVAISMMLNPDSAVEFRSEEHTSELQSLMRISYAVFCLKKKKKQQK